MHLILDARHDLNDVKIPNTYVGGDVTEYEYSNCPITWGSFTLVVDEAGVSGQLRQTYLATNLDTHKQFVRFYDGSSWGNWIYDNAEVKKEEAVLYEHVPGSSGTIELTHSAADYTYLEIYYTDNNDIGFGYTKIWNPNGKVIHLQLQEAGENVFNRQTQYTINDKYITPDIYRASFIKFSQTNVVSSIFGTNYIKIIRVVGLA